MLQYMLLYYGIRRVVEKVVEFWLTQWMKCTLIDILNEVVMAWIPAKYEILILEAPASKRPSPRPVATPY